MNKLYIRVGSKKGTQEAMETPEGELRFRTLLSVILDGNKGFVFLLARELVTRRIFHIFHTGHIEVRRSAQ